MTNFLPKLIDMLLFSVEKLNFHFWFSLFSGYADMISVPLTAATPFPHSSQPDTNPSKLVKAFVGRAQEKTSLSGKENQPQLKTKL